MRPSIALLACCLVAVTAHCLAADKVIVSGHPEMPPIVWKKTEHLVGAGPELALQALANLGIDSVVKPAGTWNEVLQKAREGRIDVIVSAFKNDERSAYLEFTDAYLDSPVVIVVKKGETFRCNCWEDLIGKQGVANAGESFGEQFDAFIKDHLNVQYTSYNRAFEMLAEDTADYLVIDLYPAVIYAKLLRAENVVEFMEKPVTVQPLRMAISKKSKLIKRLPELNRELRRMSESGMVGKVVKEQYQHWSRTMQERDTFFAQSEEQAEKAQRSFDALARDRNLDNLARFLERDLVYMDGSPGI